MNFNRKLLLALLFFTLATQSKQIDLYEIADFGKAGPFTSTIDSFATDTILFKKYYSYIFHPKEIEYKVPAIFFYPKYNTTGPNEYLHFIEHIVSRGFAVIFPTSTPFRLTDKKIQTKATSIEYFEQQTSPYKNIIDTTRLGFVGHNFGAGMIPSLARKVNLQKKWGNKSLFLYLMSPWYFHEMTDRELSTFPEHTFLLMQVFYNDNVNDPKIASELFNNIGIPNQKKEFLQVKGSNGKGMFNKIKSNNLVPLSGNTFLGKEDILDTMAIFASFDIISLASVNSNRKALSLLQQTKNNDTLNIALPSQNISPIIKTDYPNNIIKRGPFLNPWATPRNPYASITEFRKGRKLIMKHYKDKIQTVIKFLKISKQFENGEIDTIEILLNPIDTGYGADGIHEVQHDSTPSPLYEGEYVRLFSPKSINGPIPTIIMVHGYSGPKYKLFKPLIDHIVSRGSAVLFPPYPQTPLVSTIPDVLEKQTIIKNGIITGINTFKEKIDTSRIGFVGHSFGAGQIPAIAHWLYTAYKWGQNGAFLFMTAPWYISGINDKDLSTFPKNTQLLTIVFDDDRTNDHEIASEFYRSIGISNDDKDYVTIFTDSIYEYKLNANHFVPYGTHSPYGAENFHDYYGIFKLFDALLDYSFNKNKNAKIVALGNNSEPQCNLGFFTEDRPIKRMEVTDNPIVRRSQFEYFYTWDNTLNPRRNKKRAIFKKLKGIK